MTRSKRMQSVAGLAKNREDNAARLLGERRKFLEQQKQRLAELMMYREEYAKKFQNTGHQGLTISQLNEYRHFLIKLNMAIVQQREHIDLAIDDCQLFQQKWLDSRVHTQALDKVVEKYRNHEIKIRERKEQKELDECAARLGLLSFKDS